jgi:glycosyltransferase involved in cell wall biosynthesis
LENEGGRKTFVKNFVKALQNEGYQASLVDMTKASLKELRNFDVLCFSDHFFGIHSWKLLFVRSPKKILIVHGWVKKETIFALNHSNLKEKISILSSLFAWAFIPTLFDAVTSPTERTAQENKLKGALIISNAVEGKIQENNQNDSPEAKELIFTTYTSIGGLKSTALDRVIRITLRLNERLTENKVHLMVFGKYPDNTGGYQHVSFMGYSNRFLEVSKHAALFFTGKSFPDIGYAEMEMGLLGVPIAKFTENYAYEEIVDGQTGILAKTEAEMESKLVEYVLDVKNNRQRLGGAFQQYVKTNKSWPVIIKQWNQLFVFLISGEKGKLDVLVT